jgi:hypothetical protein
MNSTTIATPKTRRLRIGRLADGREAFAVQAFTPTDSGRCYSVTVWVRNRQAYGGCKVLRDVAFTTPRTRSYREAFALIVTGREKRIHRNMPICIAHKLGWCKFPGDKKAKSA